MPAKHDAEHSPRHYKVLLILCLLVTLSSDMTHSASAFACAQGARASADIGDGVVMNTCLWEKSPGVLLRVGPFELVRHGITILKTQTDLDGKLHGNFATWHDDGNLMEQGTYHRGKKVGVWLLVDEHGTQTVQHYHEGVLVEPGDDSIVSGN